MCVRSDRPDASSCNAVPIGLAEDGTASGRPAFLSLSNPFPTPSGLPGPLTLAALRPAPTPKPTLSVGPSWPRRGASGSGGAGCNRSRRQADVDREALAQLKGASNRHCDDDAASDALGHGSRVFPIGSDSRGTAYSEWYVGGQVWCRTRVQEMEVGGQVSNVVQLNLNLGEITPYWTVAASTWVPGQVPVPLDSATLEIGQLSNGRSRHDWTAAATKSDSCPASRAIPGRRRTWGSQLTLTRFEDGRWLTPTMARALERHLLEGGGSAATHKEPGRSDRDLNRLMLRRFLTLGLWRK